MYYKAGHYQMSKSQLLKKIYIYLHATSPYYLSGCTLGSASIYRRILLFDMVRDENTISGLLTVCKCS